jgi:hypothetical protein
MTHYPGMTLKKEEYYSPSDLVSLYSLISIKLCGSNVKIFNRECFIYNCDDFTKAWYINNLAIE